MVEKKKNHSNKGGNDENENLLKITGQKRKRSQNNNLIKKTNTIPQDKNLISKQDRKEYTEDRLKGKKRKRKESFEAEANPNFINSNRVHQHQEENLKIKKYKNGKQTQHTLRLTEEKRKGLYDDQNSKSIKHKNSGWYTLTLTGGKRKRNESFQELKRAKERKKRKLNNDIKRVFRNRFVNTLPTIHQEQQTEQEKTKQEKKKISIDDNYIDSLFEHFLQRLNI